MLRNRILIPLLLLLTFVSASACLAVFPKPDGTVCFDLQQGYVDDVVAWYICTDTNDFKFALDHSLTYAPKLQSACGVAAPVYLTTNPVATAKPVFSAMPGDPNYSGIWTIYYVTWTNLAARVPLMSEAQIQAAELAGDLFVTQSDPCIVVDYPIVVLGSLGNPDYKIPQTIRLNYKKRFICLPTYDVNCSDGITKRNYIRKTIITDAGDPELAAFLGANLAPGLLAIDLANTQRFWVRRGPKPPAELPLVEFCPSAVSYHNREIDYSPVMQYTILHSFMPPSTVVSTKLFLQMAIDNGCLVLVQDDQIINAPILPPKADICVAAYSIDMYIADWLLPDNDRVTVTVNGVPVLTNFQLPLLLLPKRVPLILRQGDNVVKICALNRGLLDHNTVGVAFDHVCPEFRNWIFDRKIDLHIELFALDTNECATIIIRTP